MRKVQIFQKGDLITTKAGELVVVCEFRDSKTPQRMLELQCFCGETFIAYKQNVKRGSTSSCGCYGRSLAPPSQRTHGHARLSNGKPSPTYQSWISMKARCNNPNTSSYNRYGARGIRVCDEWLGENGFENFLEDMGERPVGMTLDRIDNDGDYTPGNCRWATPKEQSSNLSNLIKITYNNHTRSVIEWSKITGVNPSTIRSRFYRGLPPEKIVASRLLR